MKLDAIDRRILRALQRDGRMQNIELAKEVGLSPSPCLRRVRLLYKVLQALQGNARCPACSLRALRRRTRRI